MMIKPITEYARKGKRRKDNNYDLIERFKGNAIYAVSEGLSGCIKVGKSTSLYQRMQIFRTSSPAEMMLEGAVFLADESSLFDVERGIHKHLRDQGHHIRGEWFKVDMNSLRGIVADVCQSVGAEIVNKVGRFLPPEKDEEYSYADSLPDFAQSSEKYVRSRSKSF